MEILLFSKDDYICQQTKSLVEAQHKLKISVAYNKDIACGNDIIIIHLDKDKTAKKDFLELLDLRCNSSALILVLLESASIKDQFEVLSLGAFDFLDVPVEDEVFLYKLEQLYRWKWYNDWEKRYICKTIKNM